MRVLQRSEVRAFSACARRDLSRCEDGPERQQPAVPRGCRKTVVTRSPADQWRHRLGGIGSGVRRVRRAASLLVPRRRHRCRWSTAAWCARRDARAPERLLPEERRERDGSRLPCSPLPSDLPRAGSRVGGFGFRAHHRDLIVDALECGFEFTLRFVFRCCLARSSRTGFALNADSVLSLPCRGLRRRPSRRDALSQLSLASSRRVRPSQALLLPRAQRAGAAHLRLRAFPGRFLRRALRRGLGLVLHPAAACSAASSLGSRVRGFRLFLAFLGVLRRDLGTSAAVRTQAEPVRSHQFVASGLHAAPRVAQQRHRLGK